MSEVEARTREALHDVVDAVGVTDNDVARMEREMQARLTAGRPLTVATARPRRRLALAAAAVLAVTATTVFMAGRDDELPRPAGNSEKETVLFPPELVGLWRNVPESPWVWEISANGRIGWTDSATGYLAGEVVDGTLSDRDGDVYTIADGDDPCPGKLRIRTTGPDAAEVTSLGDTCSPEEEDVAAPLLLERLAPGPVGPRALASSFSKYENLPISAVAAVSGSWFHPTSGTLFVVGRPGEGSTLTYVLDDDGDGATDPDQRGLVSVDASGALDARPFTTKDLPCRPRFTAMSTDNVTLTTTSGPGGCFPVGSVETWVRLN